MNEHILSGLGNYLSTEAIPGVLPVGQNSPQKVAKGLYAEQLSGSAFTAPRAENLRSWLYRIRPSVVHGPFQPADGKRFLSPPVDTPTNPNQLRWDPLPMPSVATDFIDGIFTMAVTGDLAAHRGSAAHVYAANQSMKEKFFYNADGEMLIVPQEGALTIRTELGVLEVAPGEIVVVPRGMRWAVDVRGPVRGYVCENYGAPFRLPGLGPIGANGLANQRDFLAPAAAYEEKTGAFRLVAKFQGRLWEAELGHSPLDVVAWHGNYFPYKYDLARFNTINTVSFDHPDPSIFTVLTSPSEIPGTANVDFVIFPPRWMVGEHTFRPPYFHRNVMSEYMGLIKGVYDAKATGFIPGASSLHNCMSPHGPDAETFEKASTVELKPHYQGETLAFMFETCLVFHTTAQAMKMPELQKDYLGCWRGLKASFKK